MLHNIPCCSAPSRTNCLADERRGVDDFRGQELRQQTRCSAALGMIRVRVGVMLTSGTSAPAQAGQAHLARCDVPPG
ncbi:MAG: hypothetical protein EOM03_04245 [Clostridia bacterium]|nr:hypothetical protein [Clostridia bacterium]